MNIASAKKVIAAAFLADDTVIMEGKHGLGKSACVKQFAKEHDFYCQELFLSHMEMGDVLGLPRTSDVGGVLTTTWSAPDWINKIINKAFPPEVDIADLEFKDPKFKAFVIERLIKTATTH